MKYVQICMEQIERFLYKNGLLLVIAVALVFSVFETEALLFIESHDMQSNGLIGDKAPLRNFFELTSFIATTGVLVTAIWAFAFTKSQIEEAEKARLATVYMQITSTWNSHRIMSSRMYILGLRDKFENNSYSDQEKVATKSSSNTVEDYIRRMLVAERKRDRVRHNQRTAMLTFSEDLGILCAKGYVREADVFEFIAPPIVLHVDLLKGYINELKVGQGSAYENAIRLRNNAEKFMQAKRS